MLTYNENMRRSSQKSEPEATAKVPQRRRGRDRVASLLGAAATVFVDVGYEAATMTAIAASAGAAIGSLYQFFPTKPLVADALYLREIDHLADALRQAGDAVTPCSLDVIADRLFVTLVAFVDTHPALPVVSDRRRADATPPDPDRPTMRELLADIVRRAQPRPTPEHACRAAALVHVMMKGTVAAQIRNAPDGDALIEDIRTMLRTHLGRAP
jgi:AcrR family transcriptional regulator